MILSPFTPIFFPPANVDGIESRYMQTFSTSDTILVQIFGLSSETLDFKLLSEPDRSELAGYSFQTKQLDDTTVLYICEMKLTAGLYRIKFDGHYSAPFRVTSDESLLKNTVLFQYSTADNRVRADVVAIVDNARKYFSFRVPGGFKDGGWSFSVDNEQFVTADSDIVELYSRESMQKTFTLGDSAGVPVWFGQMLNRILSCRYVYLDGIRFVRFEASVPELEQVLDGANSFVFTQKLQQINHLAPKLESL